MSNDASKIAFIQSAKENLNIKTKNKFLPVIIQNNFMFIVEDILRYV